MKHPLKHFAVGGGSRGAAGGAVVCNCKFQFDLNFNAMGLC